MMNMDIESVLTVDLSDSTRTDAVNLCPVWQWISRHASFVNVDNNDDAGVYEFIVHRSDLCTPAQSDLPSVLKDIVHKLHIEAAINYTVFYL